jgi:hypothetical protein
MAASIREREKTPLQASCTLKKLQKFSTYMKAKNGTIKITSLALIAIGLIALVATHSMLAIGSIITLAIGASIGALMLSYSVAIFIINEIIIPFFKRY